MYFYPLGERTSNVVVSNDGRSHNFQLSTKVIHILDISPDLSPEHDQVYADRMSIRYYDRGILSVFFICLAVPHLQVVARSYCPRKCL